MNRVWQVLVLVLPMQVMASDADLVKSYIEACNQRDLDQMMNMVHEDVAWLSVQANSVVVETESREALRAAMVAYFAACPSCRSQVSVKAISGNLVVAEETAEWSVDGQPREQTSLSVYQTDEGKIVRVWYYPSR